MFLFYFERKSLFKLTLEIIVSLTWPTCVFLFEKIACLNSWGISTVRVFSHLVLVSLIKHYLLFDKRVVRYMI